MGMVAEGIKQVCCGVLWIVSFALVWYSLCRREVVFMAICQNPECNKEKPIRKHKYCSRACALRTWYLKNRKPTYTEQICLNCGEKFMPTHGRMIYCSPSCGRRFRRYGGKIEKRVCKNPDCDKEFMPKEGKQFYCSPSCRYYINNVYQSSVSLRVPKVRMRSASLGSVPIT